MSLSAYTTQVVEKIKQLIHPLLYEERPQLTSKCCVVTTIDKDILVLGADASQATPAILFNNRFQQKDDAEIKLVTTGLVDQYDLVNANFIWLLKPEDYEINLVESLPVPKSEIASALSWRVRTLINYPIDEAVLEYFELPPKKNTPNAPFIGAVTAKRAYLATTIERFKNLGLHLTTIDIPELALMRLSAVYENDEKSTAFIYFTGRMLLLNISSQKMLYFTRRINFNLTANNEIDFEKISLEILRYFDFFRSQWRMPAPTRLFTAADSGDINTIAKQLSERLMNTVQPYQIINDTMLPNVKQEISAHNLLSYGCLLRKGGSNVTTGS